MPRIQRLSSPAGHSPAGLFLLLLPLLFACGGDSTDPAGLSVLSVSPATAPPGASLRISASGAGSLPAGATISIGGFPAPLQPVAAGEWLSAVPLFLTETGRVLPDAPVDLVLLDGDVIVAQGLRALTISAPPAAAGASHRALERLSALGAALESVVDDMPGEPGLDAQYLYAVSRTVTELVDGAGPNSLRTTIIALEDDPAALALLDEWFEASGVLHVIDRQASLIEAIAAGAAPGTAGAIQASRTGVPTILSDVELARRMQLYEVAKLFGETVISPTAATYGNTVGIATGLLGLAGVISTPVATAANVVSAVLAVTDFMINKVAVGVLPARIDSFGMDVTKALLQPGEVTDARLKIIAANAPPPIGVQDLVGLILAGLGAIPAPEAASLREKLLEVASFALNIMQSFISQYASANPGANLDTELVSVPDMTWEAVVTDPRLVARLSHTPQTINGLPDAVNWLASSENYGEGRIYSRTMVGPPLLSLPPGFEYNGGAFGDNIVATEPVVVMVQPGGLMLEAEFPATIAFGSAAELRIRAGYGVTGGTSWSPGIQLTLTPEGGSVAATTGTTDAEGYFTTTALLGNGSTAISIRIDASGGAESASRTVVATAEPAKHVELLDSYLLAEAYGGKGAPCRQDAVQENHDPHVNQPLESGTASVSITIDCSTLEGQAAATGSFLITRDPTTGWVRRISGTSTVSADWARKVDWEAAGPLGRVDWTFLVDFHEPVRVRGAITCTVTAEQSGRGTVYLPLEHNSFTQDDCPARELSDSYGVNDGLLIARAVASSNYYQGSASGSASVQFDFWIEFY